jgi:hypothetical protein
MWKRPWRLVQWLCFDKLFQQLLRRKKKKQKDKVILWYFESAWLKLTQIPPLLICFSIHFQWGFSSSLVQEKKKEDETKWKKKKTYCWFGWKPLTRGEKQCGVVCSSWAQSCCGSGACQSCKKSKWEHLCEPLQCFCFVLVAREHKSWFVFSSFVLLRRSYSHSLSFWCTFYLTWNSFLSLFSFVLCEKF